MPVKAYTDPTFLHRRPMPSWEPMARPDPVALDAHLFRICVLIPKPLSVENNLIAVSRMVEPMPYQFYPKIPTPPMGKLSVVTFPVIYKEQKPITAGRLYPTGIR